MDERHGLPALLVLEDGTCFRGRSIGVVGETFGELVFNTGMTGYQEVLTDPSYCGQIVVMTYPEIGIYGVNAQDVESDGVQVAGYVVHRAVRAPFNQRATQSFTDYLAQADIVALEGVDTRALTRHLRTHGAMRGAISTVDLDPEHLRARVCQSPQMAGQNLARRVTISEPCWTESCLRSMTENPRASVGRPAANEVTGPRVVVVDAGRKENIIRHLQALGAAVALVPYDADIDAVMALAPDGVLVSNGPGDPEPLHATVRLMRALLERCVPLAGICLGHQLLGLALGGKTYKMRFGHRGVNHPVKDFDTGRVLITTQNHGFAVDPTSLDIAWAPLDAAFTPSNPALSSAVRRESPIEEAGGPPSNDKMPSLTMAERLPPEILVGESPAGFGPLEITHLSLNDGTLEGLRLRDRPAFSVQYHPEAAPGPHDAQSFFSTFMAIIKNRELRTED
jgi:carbamoyl-phosphate synthase small subunit